MIDGQPIGTVLLCTVLLMLIAGCGGGAKDAEWLKVEVDGVRSVAVEAGMLMEAGVAGHVTDQFFRGHGRYLRQLSEKHLEELRKAVEQRPSAVQQSAQACRVEVEDLIRVLARSEKAGAAAAREFRTELAPIRARIQEIRQAL